MDLCENCNHSNCSSRVSNRSVCQTLDEMDWERGIWNAAFNGDIKKVESIINQSKDKESAVNAPDNAGYSALHYSARGGHKEICDLLLKNGADINAKTKNGLATPLHKAAAAGKQALIEFLVERGAFVEAKDSDGETVLEKAMRNNHKGLAHYLLKKYPQLKMDIEN